MITATVTEQTDPVGNPFPKIMINPQGTIILALGDGDFTVLWHENPAQIGYHYDSANMSAFVDYNGPLTLENI